MNYSVQIKRTRIQQGLSQEQLANRLKVNRSYISKLENGTTVPSIIKIEEVFRVMGKTVDLCVRQYYHPQWFGISKLAPDGVFVFVSVEKNKQRSTTFGSLNHDKNQWTDLMGNDLSDSIYSWAPVDVAPASQRQPNGDWLYTEDASYPKDNQQVIASYSFGVQPVYIAPARFKNTSGFWMPVKGYLFSDLIFAWRALPEPALLD